MTKLEFIDKYIELLKQKIESSKESARLYYANDDWAFGEMEEENRVGYEEELELFKQIKNDLEAWEVVKNKMVDILMVMLYFDNLQEYNNYVKDTLKKENNYKKCILTKQEYETLKKALKVK